MKTAKEIYYELIAPHVIVNIKGDITSRDLNANHIIEAMESYAKQNSHKHVVMQAEASESVSGAAVGNSAAGQSGSGGCKRTALCDASPTFGYCSHCGGIL